MGHNVLAVCAVRDPKLLPPDSVQSLLKIQIFNYSQNSALHVPRVSGSKKNRFTNSLILAGLFQNYRNEYMVLYKSLRLNLHVGDKLFV